MIMDSIIIIIIGGQAQMNKREETKKYVRSMKLDFMNVFQ